MAANAVKIPFTEAAAPSTPAAGKVVIYAKTDGLMYSKDDAGVETLVSGGAGGGAVATDAIWDAAGDLAVGSGSNTAAKLAIGATNGMAVRRVSGAVAWQLPPGSELDYVARTSDLSVTGTNEAGAQTYVSSTSLSYDGSTIILIEVFIPNISATATAAALIDVFLVEDSTAIGIIGRQRTAAANSNGSTMYAALRRTPSNASHQYHVKAYVSGGTGTATGGNGTTGNWAAGFIRICTVA
jgi:hypothetical protein